MKIQIGNIYIFSPRQFYNNPEIDRKPMIGIFLERIPDPSSWRPAQFKVLGPSKRFDEIKQPYQGRFILSTVSFMILILEIDLSGILR